MAGTGDAQGRSGRTNGRATLGAVAARAGVSPQTVSNVLNSPHLVREETAERVRLAVRELGYRPLRAAQLLRTRRSRVLGLRVEAAPGDGVFDRFLHALTDAAAERDYRIMLYTARGDDEEIKAYGDLAERWDLDGFVLTATHPGDTRTSYLSERRIACVTFGRPWDGSGHHPWVDVDGAAGTRAATNHLIAAGHRRIGFFGWPDRGGVGADRLTGWRAALHDAGLPEGPIARCDNDIPAGRSAAAAGLLNGDRPTAVVCVSDTLALGLLAEMSHQGLRAGEDVAVTGFDDTDGAKLAGLTSVSQPIAEAARTCIRLVTGLLDGPDRPTVSASAPERVLLAPSLVIRSSSQPEGATSSPSYPPKEHSQ